MILLIQGYNFRFLSYLGVDCMTAEKPMTEKQAMKKKLIHNCIELVI
jgi:hypothetical protein